ncbi:MAG: glycosyltransferase [Christensenellaceae bacterium]
MKIAIDCRYIGKSGIGRVCQGIIDNLDYSRHQFYLFGNKIELSRYKNAVIIEDNTEPYSLKGLLKFNKKIINKECDALIIPNFLIPFGIKIPVHAVMHDLIFLDVKETTNGKIDYFIKKTLLKRCMKKAKSISCVSGFTLNRCKCHFAEYADKCYINYDGVSDDVIEYAKTHGQPEKTDTIVFVGNVKRHKGLISLLDAFSTIGNSKLKLKIIGEKEGFITGLDLDESKYENVVFTGRLSNVDLLSEISKAKFLIQPSVYEGFGLPPLEALYLGTKPIISDIEVFKEIYSDLPVTFFKVGDAEDLKDKILNESPYVENVREIIDKKFNYAVCARNILSRLESEAGKK